MSRKLRDFVQLISLDDDAREEAEIGGYVSWLRRRIGLLKNIDTPAVMEIIRHCRFRHVSRDDVLFQQGNTRHCNDPLNFFILLRGSASIFVNPFLAHGKLRSGSTNSIERVLLITASSARLMAPKSASSKRTTHSRLSQPYATLTEQPESDVSDTESDTSITTEKKPDDSTENEVHQTSPTAASTPIDIVAQSQVIPQDPSPQSRASKHSRRETSRSRLGKFVVKCEKGRYFDEESLVDDGGQYNASVIMDELSDIMVIDEEIFNKYVREHHEKETTTMSNFVDIHPFFSKLPAQSRGILQISLKSQHFAAGTHIVKQGDPVNRLVFLVSGSAEVIIEPEKHRYQYPELWPFETSADVYYNECEWLRESRRRVYSQKYEYFGEVSRRRNTNSRKKTEVSVCAVQNREVVGITEIVLELSTYMSGLRCLHDCEIYTLNLKPFRRMIKKKHPEVLDLVRAYILTKLRFRLDNNIGDKVPLMRSLYNQVRDLVREKSLKGSNTRCMEKLQEKEQEMLRLLEWFKLDKAPLVKDLDPDVVKMKEDMKKKARIRESVRRRTKVMGGPREEYVRRGCIASLRSERRKPMSLHKLRDPMNELMLRLRMEGTFVADERELEELLLRYSVTPVGDLNDVRTQASRITDEEYKLLRYRRYGNRLVRNFIKMIDKRDPRHLLGSREKTILSYQSLFDETVSEFDDDDVQLSMIHEDEAVTIGGTDIASTRPTTYRSIIGTATRPTTHKSVTANATRPTTYKSRATTDTYKSLEFDRRSVTPRTLDMRIKDFHARFGGKEADINNLPLIRNHRDVEFDDDNEPVPGGKVFVTTMPCVSCMKNVHLKNHTHVRCQMLHTLPMNKVKGYRD